MISGENSTVVMLVSIRLGEIIMVSANDVARVLKSKLFKKLLRFYALVFTDIELVDPI